VCVKREGIQIAAGVKPRSVSVRIIVIILALVVFLASKVLSAYDVENYAEDFYDEGFEE